METLWQDLRYGVRMLLKNPGFTAVAAITLALGVGANSAIFSVVNGVLLKPLPYKAPEQLVRVFETCAEFPKFPISPANFLDYREQNQVFDDFATFTRSDLQLAEGDRPARLTAMMVSEGYFRLLGFEPILGRDFLPSDEQQGNGQVVVLSNRLWQSRFDSDPQIIGKSIKLNGDLFTIIGVMPSGLQHVGGDYHSLPHAENIDLWWPLPLDRMRNRRGSHFLNAIARLKPGVTEQQAAAQMNEIALRLEQQYPNSNKDWRIKLIALREEIVGQVQPMLLVVLGAVGFVLLIACVNVANLLLARATAREKEIAVRVALGAGRWRITRQILTESLLIAFLGGLLGLALGVLGVQGLTAFSPDKLPRLQMIGIDGRMFAFTLAIALLTGIIFGLVPALNISKANLNEVLKDSSRGATGGLRHRRLRGLLVVAEVALAFVLLIGAGLLMRSFIFLQRVDPGFNPHQVLTASIDLAYKRYEDRLVRESFIQRLIGQVQTLPGVRAVGASTDLPWTGYDENTSIIIEHRTLSKDDDPHARYHSVSPDYFPAIGVPLVAGRFFTERDSADAPRTLLINQSMARRYWPGEEATGKRLSFTDPPTEKDWMTVVGVVGDVKDTPEAAAAEPAFYWPVAQNIWQRELFLAIRADVDPFTLVESVRREVLAIDKDLAIADVNTLEQIAGGALNEPRFAFLLVGIFAAVALALATVGIYGVISYSVSQRTHEIGLRIALGAQQRDVVKLVVRQGVVLALTGVVIGVGSALALTRLMASLLFGVGSADPLTFTSIALLITIVSLVACYIPAHRAMKVDPMIALRSE
ncbi:MAG: ABC transporter permease [Blastocatellia bacterium]